MASLLQGCIFIGLMINVYSYNFGFNNSYTCHCLNDIQCNDQTGTCNNGCSKRWVGPSCQQENVAYKKTATQSGQDGNQGPWLAVDGNRSNSRFEDCIDTIYSPWAWWDVDLGDLFPLRYFKIYYRSDRLSSFKGFSVHIDDELCYQHTDVSNPPAIFPIECRSTITGRYVNISNNRPGDPRHYFSLCEVEIYVCSRGTYGSQCNNFCHCSNYDKCDVKTGQCPNGCQIGWDGNSCVTKCVENYGKDCNKSCTDRKCSGISTCDHVTGECINGCQPGYRGIDCKQECYGENCSKQCSDRNCLDQQSSCNNIDGKCICGCQAGYTSQDCTQICDNGFYGQECSLNCTARFCSLEAQCNNVDGACDCLDGYEGIDCTIKVEATSAGKCDTGNCDDKWTIIGTVLGLVIGIIVGGVGGFFIKNNRLKARQDHPMHDTVTGNQNGHNVTRQETAFNQPVTQTPSNTSNNNETNNYDELTTGYQNENAYEQL